MYNLALRNIKIFFRNKASVFFSLLGVIIIIMLYILFLGDTLTSNYQDLEGARFLMDSWIMAGLISVASITTTMGAFEIMVNDRENKRLKDFYSAPLKKSTILCGYLISAIIIGVTMSVISLIFAELYIVVYGGQLLGFFPLIKVLAIIILAVASSSSMLFFLISFLKNANAFATASTILGTLVGFLTGIYIPSGVLPESVQWIIKIFPVSHSAALIRKVMTEVPLNNSFAGAEAGVLENFKLFMGIDFKYGNFTATTLTHILVLLLTTALFFGLTVIKISTKNKKGK